MSKSLQTKCHIMYFNFCCLTEHCNTQGHSSLTPMYLYILWETFDVRQNIFTRTKFLDPYIFIHPLYELWCDETELCYLQGQSSLTPVHLYIQWMTFDVMRLNIAIYKDTDPWPLYICTFIEWTLMSAKNSYPQINVNYNVECMPLNYAFRYDACGDHSVMYCSHGNH